CRSGSQLFLRETVLLFSDYSRGSGFRHRSRGDMAQRYCDIGKYFDFFRNLFCKHEYLLKWEKKKTASAIEK
ncbi:MAG: hypothetical protein ACI4D3_11855, partial [Lachnospiraceae bacterium]